MARLYANENSPLPVVEGLRRLGLDVVTIQETGQAERSALDTDVLLMATEDRRAVLTLNRRDFIHLHRNSQAHEGIIVCTVDADFDGQAAQIHAAISSQSTLAG